MAFWKNALWVASIIVTSGATLLIPPPADDKDEDADSDDDNDNDD